MLMKIIVSLLVILLVAIVGAAAFFHVNEYIQLKEEYERIKASVPAYEKTSAELKQLKENESKKNAWLNPAIDALSAGLGNEIKSGKAEVLAAGDMVVVNISEEALYLPDSYTFAKESPQLRADLVDLLKSDRLKGKSISIGNTTHAVPEQGRGRKKIPAKEARTLAAERSAALVRDLEKNGVNQDALIAAAYSQKQPARGSLIKNGMTVIIIENPTMVSAGSAKQEAAQKAPAQPAPDTRSTLTVPASRPASQTQSKPIPIVPVRPKAP